MSSAKNASLSASARRLMQGLCGLAAIAVTTVTIAELAPVEASMMRPAFFAGKWAADSQMCNSASAYVELMPNRFKYASAVNKMTGKITYHQSKANVVEVGINDPALVAKITQVREADDSLALQTAHIAMRDLSDAEWTRLTRMSNGMITRASVESKMAHFKAEMASYPTRIVRCSAKA